LNDELGSRVIELSERMHRLYREGVTPQPDIKMSVCRTCSLKNICLPGIRLQTSGKAYWDEMLKDISIQ
jgi:CRISPR-associated exonuclease Cas4